MRSFRSWCFVSAASAALAAASAAQSPQALLVSLDGTSAAALPDPVEMDVDGDGEVEDIYVPEAGAGYLALDLDGDGAVDQLVGGTGDALGDLLALDADEDGWLISEEALVGGLVVWAPGEFETAGTEVFALLDVGIGDIYPGLCVLDETGEEFIPFYNGDGDQSGFEIVDPTAFSGSSASLGLVGEPQEGSCAIQRVGGGSVCVNEEAPCTRRDYNGKCDTRPRLGGTYCRCNKLGGGSPLLDVGWTLAIGILVAAASVVQGLRTGSLRARATR
jgi:hypothetical protein